MRADRLKLRNFSGKCIALIADMVGSRALTRPKRTLAQHEFASFVDRLNVEYREVLLAKFVITLGDEFQGLLLDSAALPNLIWQIETEYENRALRIGFGFGTLSTPVPEYAIGVDGECLHMARAAIETSKRKKLLGGVFRGFGADKDEILNGYARLLWRQSSTLSPQQARVVSLLRQGMTQTEAARELRVTRQAVSLYAKAAGWEAYEEGEAGWRIALKTLVPLQQK